MPDVRRRQFITLLGGAAAWPLAARSQQGERVRHIGVLMNFAADDAEGQVRLAAFLQGLQETGWAVGRNVQIDLRWGAANNELYRKYAAELMALAPDVVFASATPSVQALQHANRTVPIVFAMVGDPVGTGLVASLSATGREHHRFYPYGIRLRREMGGVAQRDRASRDAGSGASGSYHRARPVERDPGRRTVIRRGVERGRRG